MLRYIEIENFDTNNFKILYLSQLILHGGKIITRKICFNPKEEKIDT